MLELNIKKEEDKKYIALINDGILEEYYEENNESNRNEGNIYIWIVKDIIKGMQAAFVDIGTEKNGFIHLKDILPKVDETKEKQSIDVKIEDVLKVGQKVLVQVKKDSNEKKGARISTHINLPSKYIMLMPNTDIITISQKIEDKNEQKRLINLVRKNLSEGNGAVIRTAAENKEQEIIKDIKYVENKWNKIIQTSINPNENKPQLLYKSEDIIEKILIDLADKNLKNVVVNDKEEYDKIEKIKNYNEEYKDLNIVMKSTDKIFSQYDIEKQIEKIENRKIWLKCGGFITIDKTEALTAIDVNTGKYTGTKNLDQTIYKVNEEATIEIAKQLRLRDIGGIVIIDYIDMQKEENKNKIENLLKLELRKDRAKPQVDGFTKLDLMELTRKHICSHRD